MFRPPIRTALCGHNFCERCLIDVKRDREEWACPECQQVNNSSIETLPRAYLLERLVEKLKAKPVAPPRNSSGNCGKHNRAFEISELFKITFFRPEYNRKYIQKVSMYHVCYFQSALSTQTIFAQIVFLRKFAVTKLKPSNAIS